MDGNHMMAATTGIGRRALLTVWISVVAPSVAAGADAGMTLALPHAIDQAIARDPWLQRSHYQQQALQAEAVAAATLPDPRMTVAMANLPTDTFDFGQEAMTQFVVGVSQMLPRGDSLALTRRQRLEQSAQQPLLRADRRAKVQAIVTQLWLDAYLAQQSMALIEGDRALFEQMVDVTRSSYASAIGRTRQQDVVRAELELTRLDDRLTVLDQRLAVAQHKLAEWLDAPTADLPLPTTAPVLALRQPQLLDQSWSDDALAQLVADHPALRNQEQQITVANTAVALTRQKYRPEWAVNAQYGYRGDDPAGNNRADLFSLGVSFDLPLFTDSRQDQQVNAATARVEASKTDRLLLLRQFVAELGNGRARLQRLTQRQLLYREQLLPQMHEQADASLTAYTHDDGDFAEVVRARIAELNAKLDALAIQIEQQQVVAQLNYLLTTSDAVGGNDIERETRMTLGEMQ